MTLDSFLTKITKLSEAATEPPWKLTFEKPDDFPSIWLDGNGTEIMIDDLNFIDAARTLLPLLAQVCAVLAQDMNSIKNIDQGKCHNLADASLAEVAKLIQGAGVP